MPSEQVNTLVVVLAAGFGLALAALVGILARRTVRAAGVVLVLGASIAVVVAWSGWWDGWTAALLIAAGLVPCLAAGTAWCRTAAKRTAAVAARPDGRWAALGVLGLGLAVAGVVRFEAAERAQMVDDAARVQEALGGDSQTIGQTATALSDRGNPIPVGIASAPRSPQEAQDAESRFLRTSSFQFSTIRRAAADDRSNCHGWVFADGRYHVGGGVVEQILRENGYVAIEEPRPGDLVVYRLNERIVHSAVVRYVSDGQPVLVEGKWGSIGVFLHAVDASCYGTEYTYYRSSRDGHQLAGLHSGPAPQVAVGG